ncbi:MAG: ATP-binding cassette domain-containing protein [Leptospirales bacterium]|nr:ATP-binding cassette domain-containing protein [Leptospirales bacterium]
MIASARNIFYQRQGKTILSGVNLNIGENEHWILLGPNGAGKSTLIKILSGYEWPTQGHVEICGKRTGENSVAELREGIGLFEPALQGEAAVHYPGMTAEEVVASGARNAIVDYEPADPGIAERAQDLVRGQGFNSTQPFSLMSSGEQRRTLLLRAMIREPQLLILDEPYESLDLKARVELERTLVERVGAGAVSTLFAIHRIEEIPPFATHALLLKKGVVAKAGLVNDVVSSQNLSELYETSLEVRNIDGRFVCFPV